MDTSFNRATLSRALISEDFYHDNNLQEDEYRKDLIQRSLQIAEDSQNFRPTLNSIRLFNKEAYSLSILEEKLILRHCAKIIKVVSKTSIKPRNKIIRELKSHLSDGGAYRVYRLDISSFFENCDSSEILKIINKYQIGTHAKLLISSFLEEFNTNLGAGLPRGVEISPILSEIYLKSFDMAIKAENEVFYYARFVDDILILTSSYESETAFLKKIREWFPKGLHLNHNKMKVITVPKRSIGTANSHNCVAEIDYLGYNLKVIDTDLSQFYTKPSTGKTIEYRKVFVDLTDKKIKKLSTKLIRSLFSFSKTDDFSLLRDRMLFLTTNRDLVNKRKQRKVPTGMYYSYSEIDTPSKGLEKLDKLLKKLLISPTGRIGTELSGKLTKEQKAELLKMSFSKGHEKKIFKRFSPQRLSDISRIWK